MKTNVSNKTPLKLFKACACLCLGLTLVEPAIAQDAGSGDDLQIQTTLRQLLGAEQASRYQKIIEPDEPLSWEVYLPESASEEKPGVLVYISPVSSGRIHSRWRRVMDEQNMIYISPNDSGNKVRTIIRMVMATTAVRALGEQFAFDTGNIIVSGFSGGGRVASLVATQYPETFSGAIYICGVDPWEAKHTPKVERLLQNSFVFLTGSKDFNRYETRKVHKRYTDAGARHTKLIVVRGMAHVLPGSETMTEALEFLTGKAY
jgi:predicted esterase